MPSYGCSPYSNTTLHSKNNNIEDVETSPAPTCDTTLKVTAAGTAETSEES